jgi:hypothetical protein
MTPFTVTLPDPMWNKSECVPFSGAKHVQYGYGIMRFEGKTRRAHRVIYCQFHGLRIGDIDGLHVMHVCDNPPCVNPAHLRLGTHTDNMRDKQSKGRGNQPKGVRNAKAKLDDEKVRTIRSLVASGHSHRFVARMFCVNPSTITRVACGKKWSHVS